MTDYAAILEDVLAKEREEAERQGDDCDSKPGEPASDDAIAKAEAARACTFSDEYRAFLKACDGWEYFSWGVSLFSTEDLSGDEYEGALETREYDEDLTDELEAALIIGTNENDATLYMLCENGNVVRHLYSEDDRWPTLDAFLRSRIETLNDMQRWAAEALQRTTREWDTEFRAADDAALVEELRTVWSATEDETLDVSAHHVTDAETPAPSDLIARDEDGDLTAALDLGFVLFLGFCPTEQETLETFRAFRDAFPFGGSFRWQLADAMSFSANTEEDPNAEPFELKVDDQGFYGLRIIVGDEDDEEGLGSYILNVRGIPPEPIEDDDEEESEDDGLDDGDPEYRRRASFVEVLVPPTEDPAKVRALCERLIDVLPVRSGWGGYFARVRDRSAEPDPWDTVFQWCRRYFHIAPCYIDGWLGSALTRQPGVGWLTVLGKPIVDAIELRVPDGIDRHDGANGTVLTASHLTLGDIHAGDFPRAVSTLAQHLEPVAATSWSKRGTMSMGGIWFSTHSTQLPGDFADHHATEGFMRRFVDPEGLLGPTPREEALVVIEELKAAIPDAKSAEFAEGLEELDGFRDVMRALYNGAYFVEDDTLTIRALELAARYPDWSIPAVYNNLLVAYDKQDRLDDAMRLIELALKTAEEGSNAYTFHSAACLLVKAGRMDEAMHCVERAKHHGYELWDRLVADEDLAPLHERSEWKALVG